MMRCKGSKTRGFHKLAMMKWYYSSDLGNHFACPECGRVAVVPHKTRKTSTRKTSTRKTSDPAPE